jgi:hypothetical protein
MTAFIPANLPASVDTLEKLSVWSSLALQAISPNVFVVEGQGYTERVAQANPYYVPSDLKHRMVSRQSIQMDAAYLAGGQRLWTYALPITATAIPANFTS